MSEIHQRNRWSIVVYACTFLNLDSLLWSTTAAGAVASIKNAFYSALVVPRTIYCSSKTSSQCEEQQEGELPRNEGRFEGLLEKRAES